MRRIKARVRETGERKKVKKEQLRSEGVSSQGLDVRVKDGTKRRGAENMNKDALGVVSKK